jgi:hypothetical protein
MDTCEPRSRSTLFVSATAVLAPTGRKRKLLASSGAMFVCAGFALIPLFGHAAAGSERLADPTVVASIPEGPISIPDVRPHADPFARALPAVGETKVQRRGAPPKKKRDVRVIAIVMGTQPHALLSLESGATQIVGIGDAIEGTRIASIASDMVVLADGRRLQFSQKLE